MINNYYSKSLIQFLLIALMFFSGCVKDGPVSVDEGIELGKTNLMLQHFEADTDFINSYQNPPLINASSIYDNSKYYHLIDIRTPSEFSNGRIPNSINVKAKDLIDYISNLENETNKSIVLISSTGQYAAFCCSILRLNGNRNVYSLNFGISSWNSIFSSDWLSAAQNQNDSFRLGNRIVQNEYPLPNLSLGEAEIVPTYIKERSKELLQLSFDENNSEIYETDLSITFGAIYKDYYTNIRNPQNKNSMEYILDTANAFLMAYGDNDLYYVKTLGSTKSSMQTVFFNINEDIRSSEMLFKIPSNKAVFVYSYNGQRSAILTAYLRVLGYNAKSVCFGAHNMIYSIIKSDSPQNIFSASNNYEYESD